MAASTATEKIFVIFGAIFFALQMQGNFSSAKVLANDLEDMKLSAADKISKINGLLSDNFDEMMEYTQNARTWISANDQMNGLIKETADESIENIMKLADELYESGKIQEKPEEYFRCLEETGRNGIDQIQTEMKNYEITMKPIQITMLNDIDFHLYTMNKLFQATNNLKVQFIQKIHSCQDEDCIADSLRQAENAFDKAEFILTSTWNKSVGVYIKFKAIARTRVTEAQNVVSNTSKTTMTEMNQC